MYKRLSKGSKGFSRLRKEHEVSKPLNAIKHLKSHVHATIPVKRIQYYLRQPDSQSLLYPLDERLKSLDEFHERSHKEVPAEVVDFVNKRRKSTLLKDGVLYLPLVTVVGDFIGVLRCELEKKISELSEKYEHTLISQARLTATAIDDFRNHDELLESTIATKATMIFFILVLAVFMFVTIVIRYWGPRDIVHYVTSFIPIIGMIIFINRKFYTLKDFGFQRFKLSEVGFHVAVALTFCSILTVVKLLAKDFIPSIYVDPFFAWDISLVGFLIYIIPVAALQEFAARVLPYSLFKYSLGKRIRPWATIIVSSLVFAFPHIHWSMTIFIATALLGFILILSYMKVPNFYGVWISHAIIGTYAMFVLRLAVV